MRQAKDLMSNTPESLTYDTELPQAATIFMKKKITMAPVIDQKGTLCGVMTEVNLIKALVAHHAFFGTHDKVGDHPELLEKAAYVRDDAPIDQVMKTLLASPTYRLLVINDKRKLVGIISPKDILKVLAAEVEASQEHAEELMEGEQPQAFIAEAATLEEALSKMKKMIMDSSYMMHSVDAHGKVVMANKHTCDVLGYTAEEITNLTLEDLYHKKYHPDARRGISSLIRRGFHQSVNSVMMTKSGDMIPVEVKSRAVKNKHDKFLGTVTVVRKLNPDDLLPLLSGMVEGETTASGDSQPT